MVQKLARWLWFTVTVVNVDDDPALAARFEYQVPVVAIGEEVLGHAPLEESALRKALAYALAPGGAAALRERESRL